MKTITHKHILIVEMDVLQNDFNKEHLQTHLRVLNEMSYEEYDKMIKAVNLINQMEQYFEAKE